MPLSAAEKLNVDLFYDKENLRVNGQVWERLFYLRKNYTADHQYTNRLPYPTWLVLESEFWVSLELIAIKEKVSLKELIQKVQDRKSKKVRLGNALKHFVVAYSIALLGSEDDVLNVLKNIEIFEQYSEHFDPERVLKIAVY